MQLDRIVLREVAVLLKEPFKTSFGLEHTRRFIIVEAHAGEYVGYGEVTVLSAPLYNEETVGTAWHVLQSFLIPIAFSTEWETPEQLAAAFSPIRRNNMAKAGLEGAVWDIYAQANGMPLAKAIGGVRDRVPSGVSIGMQPDVDTLVRTVGAFLEQGYQRIKVKIKPGWDELPLRALRAAFGDLPLMADANSSYTLRDIEALRQLDDLYLMMIEQPLAHDDIIDHAQLQGAIETPICLDESILTAEDARKALGLGSCRIINIKVGRVGGFTEARRLHDLCKDKGAPVWCGGMLESGIGRAHNIALATLPNFTLPGDISASSRYWEQDIIEPEVTVSADGYIQVPTRPGLGFEVRRDLLDQVTVRLEAFEPD